MILTLENDFNSGVLWEMILTLGHSGETILTLGHSGETILTLGHSGKIMLTLEDSRALWERILTLATLSQKDFCWCRLDQVEGFDIDQVDKVSIEEHQECTLYKDSPQTSDWFILEKITWE